MTHGDRIRAMTDEELVLFIKAVKCCSLFAGDGECEPIICEGMRGERTCGQLDSTATRMTLDWLGKEI